MTQKPNPNRIQIEIPATLHATYSNFAIIAHTQNEFFVDFAQLLPGIKKTQVNTRVVMSPTHAKLLYRALGENLERYENQHGQINVPPTMADQLADQLFGGIRPTQTGTESAPDDTNNE